MTTAIYLTKCQYSATRTATPYKKITKPNSKIEKLRIRLIIAKMQAKDFNLEFLRLHPNRGHGTPESALGNSLSGRSVSYKSRLKEADKKTRGVSHNIRNRESRKTVPAHNAIAREYANTRVKPSRNPTPDHRAGQCRRA